MTIKEIREGRRLTQQQVANAVGVTSTAYARIERGEVELTECKYKTVYKLSQILGSEILEIVNEKIGGTKTMVKLYLGTSNCILYEGFKPYMQNEAENFIESFKNDVENYLDDIEDNGLEKIVIKKAQEWLDNSDVVLCDERFEIIDPYENEGEVDYIMADGTNYTDTFDMTYYEIIKSRINEIVDYIKSL